MKNLVVLTGAGVSAESGIRTFRDSDGLWEDHDVMEVASTYGWEKNPKLVLEFYNMRRKQLLSARPNAAHFGLKSLEAYFNVEIVTQNVDNLHEQAGSSKVLHLHGELMKVRSLKNDHVTFDVPPDNVNVNLGDLAPDGGQLRPHIVFFGEAVPAMEEAIPLCEKAEILVVIGTSLAVYPAAGLLHYAPKGTPIFVLDPNQPEIRGGNIHFIQEKAASGFEILKEKLMTYV